MCPLGESRKATEGDGPMKKFVIRETETLKTTAAAYGSCLP